jgi:hypothetical protein
MNGPKKRKIRRRESLGIGIQMRCKALQAYEALRRMVDAVTPKKRTWRPSQVLWAIAHGTTALLIDRPKFP